MSELAQVLTALAALISASVVLLNVISKKRKASTEKIEADCVKMKNDIAVIKEAVYYALVGVVELGANGDTALAKERLKDCIFKEKS